MFFLFFENRNTFDNVMGSYFLRGELADLISVGKVIDRLTNVFATKVEKGIIRALKVFHDEPNLSCPRSSLRAYGPEGPEAVGGVAELAALVGPEYSTVRPGEC